MVTEYLGNTGNCGYKYDKLKNHIYIVPSSHAKNIHIDSGSAYIDQLTAMPELIKGYNITLNEQSSLDERYKFQKTVTLSMNGYVSSSLFDDKYYVILEGNDGTLWFVNPDFPTKLTYNFTLNDSTYQTDFTFSLTSNFPTLKLDMELPSIVIPCQGYGTNGIKSLVMLEKEYSRYDSQAKTVFSMGKSFQPVEFLGKSCSLTESFDGQKATSVITFNIGFDAYKSSWHYNLLEFVDNLYTAVITPQSGFNKFYCGFGFGLQPSFVVQTDGDSDIITITLTEAADFKAADDFEISADTNTVWQYITTIGNQQAFDCVDDGIARYLVKQETNVLGVPTGRYMVKDGYQSWFPHLNIIGTFDTDERFVNPECTVVPCKIFTNMPPTLTFYDQSCQTYQLSAICDWNVTNNTGEFITITPSSGAANTLYDIEVCNTEFVTHSHDESFNIHTRRSDKEFGVKIVDRKVLYPDIRYIDCLEQYVRFNFNADCPTHITTNTSGLSYVVGNGYIDVLVPYNPSTTQGRTFTLRAVNCEGLVGTIMIYQDTTKEEWRLEDGYICDEGDSYERLVRYTGTTLDNINTPTGEEDKGDALYAEDERCKQNSRWYEIADGYICIDGDKWSIEEFEESFDGSDWTSTDITRWGRLIESGSTECEGEPIYQWRLSEQWQCGTGVKMLANYSDNTSYTLECNSSSTLSLNEGHFPYPDAPYSAMTSVVIGNCVTDIANRAFIYCTSLSSITIPNSVKTIGSGFCSNNTSLKSITIPNSVTSLGSESFYRCTSLTSATLSSGMTTINISTFHTCGSLSSVTIPNTITSIGSGAFYGCSGLTSINIPSTVTTLGSGSFSNCSGLTSIEIPSGVTTIANSLFKNCSSLRSVNIPSGVTSIGYESFEGCSSLSSITIPNTVTSMDGYAFSGCTSLTSVTIPSSVTTSYAEFNDCTGLLNAAIECRVTPTFNNCTSLSSVSFTNNLEIVQSEGFKGCTSLTSVTIPSSVTDFGYDCFRNCTGLTSVTVLPTTPPTLGSNAFNNTNDCPIYVPAAAVSAYQSASGWSNYSSRIQAIGS